MRAIRLLSLRRLRLQPLRAILAAIVVGAGTSLVAAIVIITSSLNQSVEEAGRALAGPAPLRVVGPVSQGGISPTALQRVATFDGVDTAVPLVQGVSLGVPDDGGPERTVVVLGLDCRIEELFGDFDCDQDLLGNVMIPFIAPVLHDLLGDDGQLRTNLGRIPLTDAIEVPQLDGLNDGRTLAFAMPEAQRQLGRDKGVDVVYLLPDPGVPVAQLQSDLQAELGDAYAVLDALDPPPVIGLVLAGFIPLLTMIAFLTLGIGGVLVRNSIALSLEERRRQIAIVGALGGSARTLLGGTFAEMVLLGVMGGLLGVLGGIAIAGPVAVGLDDFAQRVAGFSLDLHPTSQAVYVALAVGVGVACLASVGPARRSLRVEVSAELAGRSRRDDANKLTSWWRIALAVLVAGVGVCLCYVARYQGGIDLWRSRLAPFAFMTSMLPMVFVIAGATPLVLGAIERRFEWKRASTRLAFANLRREPRRAGVMAVAIGFAVGVGFVTSGFNVSINRAIRESLLENLEGIEVASTDFENEVNVEARLDPQLLKRLAKLPGVDDIERGTTVAVGSRSGELIGVSAYTDPWLNGDVAVGELDRERLEEGAVIIGPGLARSEDVRPGDDIELETRKGRVSFPVMAVVLDGDFGGRTVQMDYALVERLFGPQAPLQVVVIPEPGVEQDELAATIRDAGLDPSLEVRTLPEVLDRVSDEVAEQLSAFDAIQRGLLIMSFVAVLSTLLLAGVQRQREFGMLGAVGMTPPEVRRMVILEAGLVAVGGTFVASFTAVVMLWTMLLITPVVIGYNQPFVLDLAPLGRYAVIGVIVAVLASLYPARRAAQVEVLEALRYE